MSPSISVVICTYNRADLLADVLETVGNQTTAPACYEVLVVDNNSTDRTREVVENAKKCHANIRYYLEERQGLSHARNRGWKEARAPYVAYLDDDARAPEQWLSVAKDIIDRHSPGVFGGPYYAFYKSKKPKWWKDSYRSVEHAEQARPLKRREYLSGGNIVFRRDLLERVGGFDPNLGMSGSKIRVGEETRLIDIIRDEEPNELIYYEPDFFIYHLVHAEKMRMPWLVKHWFSSGRSGYHVFPAAEGSGARQSSYAFVVNGLRIIKKIITSLKTRDRIAYPYIQNLLVEVIARDISKLGSLYERWHETRVSGRS